MIPPYDLGPLEFRPCHARHPDEDMVGGLCRRVAGHDGERVAREEVEYPW